MQAPAHFHYLDGWRGLAIFFLLVGHFFPVPGINFGAVGVNLFFVLSGLLMARLLFVQQVPLAQFYQRRIARIFPAVLVFLLLMVLILLLLGQPLRWDEVAVAALFVNNYTVGASGSNSLPFGHFWSLCVEEHSYILLSLLAVGARRYLARAGTLVGAAALASGLTSLAYTVIYRDTELWRMSMHSEVAAFGILSSAALMLWLHGRTLPRLPGWSSVALVVLGIALHWWTVPPALRLIGGIAAFALAINLLAGASPAVHALLALRPLRTLGLWSFSLYVWQQPFYLLSKYHGMHPVLGVLLAGACGVASYYLVERPSRNWLNARFGARTPAAATVVSGEAPPLASG
ncbi:acyltransferase [Massilia sp. CF038]|uniref:acyltransferase family protein n=1 Tax=Massilia sp. CF038 TaxID=1881045 RepID=UPI0009111B28|nr:acyltransferase [Massilia sp. CF038]SHH51423.1 Peptidoglycan/LPS O-acetylase OafA/YrhL, contains acyltransferase and SGNH-hydrolase domains [Massilia sp. CF038]